MSWKVNYSPLPQEHTSPPPLGHKERDVARGTSMKGQTLPGAPEIGIPPSPAEASDLRDPHHRPRPDGAGETSRMERLLNKCRIRNQLLRECMAECLGIYVLIVSSLCL